VFKPFVHANFNLGNYIFSIHWNTPERK
jgi:hypothetical protein